MTTNTKTIMQSQQVAIALTLTVTTKTDDDIHLGVLPLVQLTPVIFVLWQLSQWVTLFKQEAVMLASDIFQLGAITGKLLTIGLNSLAYGLVGVSL